MNENSIIFDWGVVFAIIIAVIFITLSIYNGDFLWTAIFLIVITAIVCIHIKIKKGVRNG